MSDGTKTRIFPEAVSLQIFLVSMGGGKLYAAYLKYLKDRGLGLSPNSRIIFIFKARKISTPGALVNYLNLGFTNGLNPGWILNQTQIEIKARTAIV